MNAATIPKVASPSRIRYAPATQTTTYPRVEKKFIEFGRAIVATLAMKEERRSLPLASSKRDANPPHPPQALTAPWAP